jgi:transcriptional regulator with XRE-family HTH domain
MTKEDLLSSKDDGIKLQIVRNNKGLSVEEFSEKTNINSSFLNIIEKGYLPLPTRDKKKISEAFGLQENWFDEIDTSNYEQSTDSNIVENTMFTNKQVRTRNIVIKNGDILKSTRITMGLSRKEIAEAIGITPVQIGYIETGKRTLTEKVRNKLNDYFNTNSLFPEHALERAKEIIKNSNCVEDDIEFFKTNIDNDEILDKLRMIKKEQGYNQAIVSEKSGVNRSQLSMIENGKIQISKKVKVKLLNFISIELENIKCNSKNALSGSSTACISNSNIKSSEQKYIKDALSDNIVTNKYELIKVVESMKKTRDDLINNINTLEKILEFM